LVGSDEFRIIACATMALNGRTIACASIATKSSTYI